MATAEKPNRVLITGGNGCLGSFILDELLKQGYSVRATCRKPKLQQLRDTYPAAGDQLEIVEIADILTANWSTLLAGIDGVIHVAAPVYHPETTSEEIYNPAVIGTEKLLEAVGNSSVKHFVLTCSVGAFFKPDFSNIFSNVTFDHNTWSEIDDIVPQEHEPSFAYLATKAISDKVVWKAAEKYPNVDFSVVLPPTVYGKFLEHYPRPAAAPELNGNKFIYELFQKDVKFPSWPVTTIAHNRDVAKVHVACLTAPPLPKGQKKRFIVCCGKMTWVDAINYLKEQRPDIASRLPDTSLAQPQSQYDLDVSLTETVLGFKASDYVPWKVMLLEVVDWLLEWEKTQKTV
ncbi:methylglyoxal reductase (NADPH-dependent) gre2 [Marasmius tenuissimus]|nr:methylglyoxal reductase (NADPH-dependent) gre2 [Marasmius tenuissimus]